MALAGGASPHGLSDVLVGSPDLRRDLVLVEGVFDLHQLRAHGLAKVAALGGTGARPELFGRLASLGVETVTLSLDNDEAGRKATARAVEQAAQATKSPALFVVDPRRLSSAKDPDAYVLTRGIAAWRALLAKRQCAIAWFVGEHLCGVNADSSLERNGATHFRELEHGPNAPASTGVGAGGRRQSSGCQLWLQPRFGRARVPCPLLDGAHMRSITRPGQGLRERTP